MLVEECEKFFGSKDLYDVLHIENKTATTAEVKKAYYRQSMKWHPDKASTNDVSNEDATAKFQLISKVYEILSDKEKRALYDESGIVDEENVISNEDTFTMWRKVFKKVTSEDIEKFCAEYKDSEEERNDVKFSFGKWKGDMDKIMNDIIGTSFDDEDRIKAIIDSLIADGTLKSTKKYKSSTSKAKAGSRQKKGAKEAKEAEEEMAKIKKKEGTDDLQALILKRQASRAGDSFYDDLAAKYAPKPKKNKKK